jgi:hypothetical protein
VLAAIAEDGQLGLIDGQQWTGVAGAPPCDPAVYPEVILTTNNKVVAAFAKLAAGENPAGTQDHPLSKVFAVDGSTEKFELEVGLIGQALTPLRLGAKEIYGVVFAARRADGKTALHLWSPFLGEFVRVDDPMPASSRYVQSPVKMTPDGLWLCPLVSGSVAVSQITEGTVAAADVVRCLVLPHADPAGDWTNRLLRVPDDAASLMRISLALASPGGGALIVVDVELGHLDLAGVVGRQLLDNRGDHAAGGTPRCPEVDHRQAGLLLDFRGEGLVLHFDCVRHRDSM